MRAHLQWTSAFIHVCDRLAAKFTPLEVEKIVDKKNKIKRFIICCMCVWKIVKIEEH